jgi:hypothetical protein
MSHPVKSEISGDKIMKSVLFLPCFLLLFSTAEKADMSSKKIQMWSSLL